MSRRSADNLVVKLAEERLAQVLKEDRARPGAELMAIPEVSDAAAELWVVVDGHDQNDGSAAAPLASLAAARDHIRALRANGMKESVIVRVGAGTHTLHDTFSLEAQDSGSSDGSVVYRAEKSGRTILSGGQRLTSFTEVSNPAVRARLPEESRGHVVEYDLRANGVRAWGDFLPTTMRTRPTTHSTLELFVDGVPMPVARWPKEGWIEDSVVIPDRADKDGHITEIRYTGERPLRWREASQAKICGYLQHSWLETTVALDHVDVEGGHLVTSKPFLNRSQMNIPAYPGVPADHDMRYRVVNLLEELSDPGEWFLDRETGLLYLYPPVAMETACVEVSVLPGPLVVARDVSYLRFEGLIFELGQQDGLHLVDSSDCLVYNCVFRCLAGGAVNIDGGQNDRIRSCELHTLGRNGTWISGGDRRTLEPAGHVLENCHIHNFSRLEGTNTPAVRTAGVGIRIAHNHIHHTPASAMRIDGNDHLVEYNVIHDAVTECNDQGAIDAFGNPTFRGCIYRYNYFHHIGTERSFAVAGIRGDDCISGMVIYGNLFFRASDGHFGAVQMNGGRENIVFANLIVDCKTGFSGGWTPGWTENNRMWKLFHAGGSPNWTEYIMSDLYLDRYPLLHRMKSEKPVNFIWNNVVINADRTYGLSEEHVNFRNNAFAVTVAHGLERPTADDLLALLPQAVAKQIGFERVPVERVGIVTDRVN